MRRWLRGAASGPLGRSRALGCAARLARKLLLGLLVQRQLSLQALVLADQPLVLADELLGLLLVGLEE